ncbi:MAG: sigma-70 family RNA polymerase sigma factor [Oscillospiraceae bacterium]
MDDSILLRRIKKGDENAFDELIKKYYPEIFTYAYRFMGKRADAEDITQETFLRFIKNFDEYTHQNKCKNFLYVIAGNLCKNALSLCENRKTMSIECIQENVQSAQNSLFSNVFIAKNDIEENENILVIEKAIQQLNSEEKELLLLRYTQDLKFAEIAKITNLSPSTVKYKLKRTVNILQKLLERKDFYE